MLWLLSLCLISDRMVWPTMESVGVQSPSHHPCSLVQNSRPGSSHMPTTLQFMTAIPTHVGHFSPCCSLCSLIPTLMRRLKWLTSLLCWPCPWIEKCCIKCTSSMLCHCWGFSAGEGEAIRPFGPGRHGHSPFPADTEGQLCHKLRHIDSCCCLRLKWGRPVCSLPRGVKPCHRWWTRCSGHATWSWASH